MSAAAPWSQTIGLGDLNRGPVKRSLSADAEARGLLAAELDLVALHELSADLTVSPWLDGAEVTGRWRARVEQTCGVSLEAFETALRGDILVRFVPAGSANAPPPPSAEVDIDLEAEDPPEVLEGERIDLTALVVEHLAMEIDPYPRKPGVEFEPPPEENPPSPFAVLRRLKE